MDTLRQEFFDAIALLQGFWPEHGQTGSDPGPEVHFWEVTGVGLRILKALRTDELSGWGRIHKLAKPGRSPNSCSKPSRCPAPVPPRSVPWLFTERPFEE